MITLEQAIEIAKKLKPDINNYSEYSNAYVFGNDSEEESAGGVKRSPVAILKADGKAISMVEFCITNHGEEITNGRL